MAIVKVFNDIFDDNSKDFIYDTSRPLLDQIEEHIDTDIYKTTLVECYDPETGKTFYAPMEDDSESNGVLIVVNGKSVDKDYVPQEHDIVNVVFTPLGGENATVGAIIGGIAGVIVGIVTFAVLAATWPLAVGVGAAFALMGIGGGLGALIGWGIGAAIDAKQAGTKINKTNTADKEGNYPDVRGASNQSLAGNNFPYVIGKHYITPFIVGDPYTEYLDKEVTTQTEGNESGGSGTTHQGSESGGSGTTQQGNENPSDSGSETIHSEDNESGGSGTTQNPSDSGTTHQSENSETGGSGTTHQGSENPSDSGSGTTDPSNSSIKERGTEAYIRVLLCVGYAPLKLTDFKLGDFWLAYNRSHNNITKDTMLAGLLKGYSTSVADDGDIVDYWKNNDVSMEILQQPATGTGIGYGTIYPEVAKEQEVNANIMYVASGDLDESVQVTYKGSSFPNTFRTNTVIFTEACPRQFTITLDFPNGLYRTYTKSTKNGNTVTTDTMFATTSLWMLVQWRIYNQNNEPSQNDGSDYSSWNNIEFLTPDGEHTYTGNFTAIEALFDMMRHAGNKFTNTTTEALYGNYIGKNLQNFTPLGGGTANHQPGETRVSATVTLTKEQCKQIIADTNPGRLVEIRVIRVSPNYIDQVNDTDSSEEDTNTGPSSYSDHVIVKTVVTKIFDEEALKKNDELVAVRPVSETDLKKFVYVALKCKADSAGYIQQSLDSINCIAESFSPIWDKTTKTLYPGGIHKVRKYYGYFIHNTNTRTNRTNDADEREVTKAEYEQARHDGYNWYMEKCGSNYADIMKGIVMSQTAIHNDVTCWYLPSTATKYNDNLTSSGFLLSLFGPQSGPEGVGEEDVNIVSIGDWAEKIEALTDGSTFDYATTYNGVQYNAGDLVPVRMECNAYIYGGTKLEDVLQKIAACGRAVWVIDESGKVKVIMDAPVDYTKGVIAAENCITSSNSFSFEEPPAGLFCTFNDENDGFENNSFYIWSDGNSMSRHHGSVDAFHMDYVTNPYQMHSLGRYYLACLVQTREVLTRKIGPGGMIYSLGDVVLVQSRELLIGETSGRIQEVIEKDGFIYGFVTDATYEYTGELDSDGNSNQGVTVIQPRYMGKSNAATLPLSAPRTIETTVGYQQVYPDGTENPQSEGWYEKVSNQYVLTTDTTVVDGHTYYEAEKNTYTLAVGTTNVVLFGKLRDYYHDDRDYAVQVDTSNDPSPTNEVKYNFKTGDICLYGLIEKIAAPYRITKIKPEAGGKFTETLVPYDESLYNYGAELPSFQTYITPPPVGQDPVTLIDVPTNLAAQQNLVQQIYNMVGFVRNDTPPDSPTNVNVTATRDYLFVTWSINDVQNTKETVIEISRANGTEDSWVKVASIASNNYKYYFDRSTDGYPEKTHITGKPYLGDFKFRLKNVSMFGVESTNWTTPAGVDLTTTDYGTWIIPQIKVNTEVVDRTVIITALYDSNDTVYGTPKAKLRIKRTGNTEDYGDGRTFNEVLGVTPDQDWLEPEFKLSPLPDNTPVSDGIPDTEQNYHHYTKVGDSYVPSVEWYSSNTYKISHTLPLMGQNQRLFDINNDYIGVMARNANRVLSIPDVTTEPATPSEGDYIHYTGTTTATLTSGLYYQYRNLGTIESPDLQWVELPLGYVILYIEATSGDFEKDKFYRLSEHEVFEYNAVTPAGTENPSEEGWYEKVGDDYFLSEDTAVNGGKTYYERTSSTEEYFEELIAKTMLVPTGYEYQLKMTNESGYETEYADEFGQNVIPVLALCTNISDIVHSHEHYKDLYVEKLSAINANIGLISQGGMGDFANQLNYWALSTLSAEDSGVAGGVKQGAFRVGGRDQYFQVTPRENDPTQFDVELRAGSISLSTQSSREGFIDGTNIYEGDPDTALRRLHLTSEGMIAQSRTILDDTVTPHIYSNWEDKAQIKIDGNNNMIITNSDTVPDFGFQVNGDIYHFDSTATSDKTESGTNPQSIDTTGGVAVNNGEQTESYDTTNQLLSAQSSPKSLFGDVTKTISSFTGDMVFFSKAEKIILGNDHTIATDGTVEAETIPAPLSGYNQAMREQSTEEPTMTVGAFLGLNETQVQKGIFY